MTGPVLTTGGPDRLEPAYDVVVIGSGAAGLLAAVRAAEGGLSVLVLEKADKLGGTTAVGGGVIWAPCNHLMAGAGFTDTEADAAAYLTAATHGAMTDAEIGWYLSTAPQAVRFLTQHTRVSLTPLARPDYHPDWPGVAEGRGLDNDHFDPAGFPGLADALRAPTYFPLISMNERDALRGAAPDPALLARRAADGVRTMGGALAGALAASALDRRIPLVRRAPVERLERHGGGWRLTAAQGLVEVTAANVVIASGGFEWNPALRSALLKFPITPISAPGNEGDGLLLGLAAGAAMADMTAIWGVPVITAPDAVYDGMPSGRMGNVEMTLPGSITVNTGGRRFVNEAMNYHDLSRVFTNIDPHTGRQENNPAWLVFDRRYLERYPVAGSTPGRPARWMAQAPDLGTLARKIGVDAAGLEATVAAFNADATAGVDTAFGRGSTAQDRHLGDPANTPNPCLAPLSQPPYYAVRIHAGALGTAGGLKVNLDGQVLDRNGAPIAGLFAAGNCSATVFHDAYPGGGATLGSAITRAFAVGQYLAGHYPAERHASTPGDTRGHTPAPATSARS